MYVFGELSFLEIQYHVIGKTVSISIGKTVSTSIGRQFYFHWKNSFHLASARDMLDMSEMPSHSGIFKSSGEICTYVRIDNVHACLRSCTPCALNSYIRIYTYIQTLTTTWLNVLIHGGTYIAATYSRSGGVVCIHMYIHSYIRMYVYMYVSWHVKRFAHTIPNC